MPLHLTHISRTQMDELVEKSNELLVARGFGPMPLDAYDFYRKSDAEIMEGIAERNARRRKERGWAKEPPETEGSANDHRGTKMVLRQYLNWLESGGEREVGAAAALSALFER